MTLSLAVMAGLSGAGAALQIFALHVHKHWSKLSLPLLLLLCWTNNQSLLVNSNAEASSFTAG